MAEATPFELVLGKEALPSLRSVEVQAGAQMDLEAWSHLEPDCWACVRSIGWAQHSQALMSRERREGWNPCALPHQGTQTGP